MKTIITLLLALAAWMPASAQTGQAYVIYDKDGHSVTFEQMADRLVKADVVCYGELHNNAMTHWLELQTLKALNARRKGWALGMEMLEADNQIIIDEWEAGLINTEKMNDDMRLWPNHETDYQPLIDAAEEAGMHVVATNVPRRYAAMVNKRGLAVLDSLSAQAKTYMAPLPITYRPDAATDQFFKMMGGMGGKHTDSDKLQQAQAIKDATMAWHIAQAAKRHKVFHVNGSFHSNNHSGIVTYLKEYKPDAEIITISTVTQEQTDRLEDDYKGIADYIICTPEDMARSY